MKLKIQLLSAFLMTTMISLAQSDTSKVRSLEVYGFLMTDAGYNVDQINPNWFDAMRVTKLPTSENQYAPSGNAFFSIRQSRFGVRAWLPTPVGELKTVFEFDMFGVGVDEGQTTMRPRHFYGEIGRWLVGQTNSPFMDGDVFPNTVEYWGPTGMVFFRNIQIRYAALQGDNELFLALERPGASADQGAFANRIELDSVKGRFPVPDFSVHFKKSGKWGHVQLAGMLRYIKWEDYHKASPYNISGSLVGWGLHLSSVLNVGALDAFRGSVIYGAGVENYMNDAPIDVGIDENPGNAVTPIKGKALPVLGVMAYYEHYWTKMFSTTFGYSLTHIQNTDFGSSDAYKMGQYATITFVLTPFKNTMVATEVQYGKRDNFSDGFSSHATKVQFSFKYNFSQVFYRKKSND